jgi:alpha-amylase
MDAVQHFSETFTAHWVDNLREHCGDDIFVMGEFWVGDRDKLTEWLGKMDHKFSVFDSPLLYNFSRISTSEKADLSKVFDGSLIQVEPYNAVVSRFLHPTW